MSVIQEIKNKIDFSIFCSKQTNWNGMSLSSQNSVNSFRLSTSLTNCQNFINSINSNRPENFDKDSLAKVNKVKSKVKDKIKKLKEELKGLENKLEKSKENKLKSKITDLKSRISNLKSAIIELNQLINSVNKYRVESNSVPRFDLDTNRNTGVIYYNGTEGSLLNELKHAFQFETGKIDFIKKDNNGSTVMVPGLIYDRFDELETLNRQYAYDGFLKIRIAWNDEAESFKYLTDNAHNIINKKLNFLNDDENIRGILEIKSMKLVTADIVIKIKDTVSNDSTLYATISTKSLDKYSTLNQIKKNNSNRKDLGDLSWMGLNNFKKKTSYIEFVKVFIKEKPFIYVK